MYPRNSASPEPVAIGPVIAIADGAVQTSGCIVRVFPKGGAEGDGVGTTAYSTDGIVLYTPTQAETNYTSFILIAKKTGCIPASTTVVTSAASTAGQVVTDSASRTASKADVSALTNVTLAATTGLGNQTADITGAVSGNSTHDAAAVYTAFGTGDQLSACVTATGFATPTNITEASGITLAATGLDLITATEPSAKPTTFPGWIMWLIQRMRSSTLTATTLTVKTEAGANVTTQTVSDDGTTETIGPPT